MTTRSSLRAVPLLSLLLLLLPPPWLTAPAAAAPAPRAHPRPRAPAPSDRSLHIRSIPAVSGLSSNVYEVLMQPYHFEVPALTAVAELAAAAGAEAEEASAARGTLTLWQPHPPVGPLLVAGNLTGLPAGRLALEVHRWGDLRAGCDAATGPAYGPYMVSALGAVGVVEAGEDGAARVHLLSPALALAGPYSVLGRALVLRPLPADAPAGPAGPAVPAEPAAAAKAVACGVIALARSQPPPPPPPPTTRPPPPGDAAAGVELLERP